MPMKSWTTPLWLGAAMAATWYLGLQASFVNPVQISAATPASSERALLDHYCVSCHNDRAKTAGLTLTSLDPADVGAAPDVWEKVVRKLSTASMPPPGRPRPDKTATDVFVAQLVTALDRRAALAPNPGRQVISRLNRSEYVNAIRDLLAVELDGPTLLPADDVVEGFDNVAGSMTVSPLLMERYLAAARRASRLAVGDPTIGPSFGGQVYELSTRTFQDDRMSEDLPFGSRGGLAVRHRFPLNGDYQIKVLLRRNLYNFLKGLREPHELEIRIDGARVRTFTVGGGDYGTPPPISFAGNHGVEEGTSPEWEEYHLVTGDAHLEARVPVQAGTRVVGVSFVQRHYEPEGIRQPGPTAFHFSIDESLTSASGKREPAVDSVSIFGPYTASGPGDTVSRQRLFVCHPRTRVEDLPCATRIMSTVARRAFRRPVTDADVRPLLRIYEIARETGDFESGIQEALTRILVDPEFLFRIEAPPERGPAVALRRLTDVQLATRLSFFLWSSIPDDELLELAERGRLGDGAVLEQQVGRMLRDDRSRAMVDNFASQWLGLQSLRGIVPNPEIFPETVYDETLREAFKRETELFVGSQLREDHSVVQLLTANYTYLNERLARHYGIPNVYGSRFRRVSFPNDQRGGLIGQGSILMLTSYADRTSAVLRGKWLLDNVFGAPPPDPPPNIPALKERGDDGKPVSLREALAQHRRSPVCASCHSRMDPLGLALENYDAIGKWRTISEDGVTPIDASGSLPDGTHLDGVAAVRKLAVSHRAEFIETLTEKMLMYALGRGIEYDDMPTIRGIVREAAPNDYRWSAIILGIVKSVPFQMRRSES